MVSLATTQRALQLFGRRMPPQWADPNGPNTLPTNVQPKSVQAWVEKTGFFSSFRIRGGLSHAVLKRTRDPRQRKISEIGKSDRGLASQAERGADAPHLSVGETWPDRLAFLLRVESLGVSQYPSVGRTSRQMPQIQARTKHP